MIANVCGNVGTLAATTKVYVVSVRHDALSVARTINVEVPSVVGVPDNTAPESDIPAGTVPDEIVKVYGAVPPEAVNVAL